MSALRTQCTPASDLGWGWGVSDQQGGSNCLKHQSLRPVFSRQWERKGFKVNFSLSLGPTIIGSASPPGGHIRKDSELSTRASLLHVDLGRPQLLLSSRNSFGDPLEALHMGAVGLRKVSPCRAICLTASPAQSQYR